MNRLRQSLLNLISGGLGYIIPMFINLITTPLLIKTLGTAAYGLQSLVAVIIGYLSFMDMGLDLPIMKFLAEFRAKKDLKSENHLLNTTLQLYLIIGFVGMILIFFSAKFLAHYVFKIPNNLENEAIVVFRLTGIGFLGSVGMTWGRSISSGLQRFEISSFLSILINSSGALLGLGVVYAGYGVVGYVLTRSMLILISGPLYFLVTKKLLPDYRFYRGLNREIINKIKSYIGYGTLIRIISSFAGRLDQILLGVFIGITAAGIYAVPFLIRTTLLYMFAAMLGFTFPMASELNSLGQMGKFKNIFIKSSKFVALLAGLIFIPLIILGDTFLKLWTPTIASEASVVFCLLCISGYLGALTTTIPNNVIIGLGKIKQYTLYSVIRSIILALLLLLFIPHKGIIGAGLSLLIICIIDIIYLYIFLIKFVKLSPRIFFQEAYLLPLILAFIQAIVAYFMHPLVHSWLSLILVVCALEIIFITLGLCMGILGEDEKQVINRLLDKLHIISYKRL